MTHRSSRRSYLPGPATGWAGRCDRTPSLSAFSVQVVFRLKAAAMRAETLRLPHPCGGWLQASKW